MSRATTGTENNRFIKNHEKNYFVGRKKGFFSAKILFFRKDLEDGGHTEVMIFFRQKKDRYFSPLSNLKLIFYLGFSIEKTRKIYAGEPGYLFLVQKNISFVPTS